MEGVGLCEKDFSPLNPESSTPSPSLIVVLSPLAAMPASSTLVNSDSKELSSSLHAATKPNSSPTSSWSSLFHFDKAARLQYNQPLVADGKPSVFILKSVHNLGISTWEDCLAGQFLGASPPLSQI